MKDESDIYRLFGLKDELINNLKNNHKKEAKQNYSELNSLCKKLIGKELVELFDEQQIEQLNGLLDEKEEHGDCEDIEEREDK